MNLKKLFFKKIKVRKIYESRKFRRGVLATGLVVVGIAAAFFLLNIIYKDRVFPQTYIGGTNFGGQTEAEATIKLKELIAKAPPGQFNYSFEGKTYDTNLQELEASYDGATEETIKRLLAVGREGSFGKILADQLRAIFMQNKVLAAFNINNDKLNDYLASIRADIDIPVKDATIEIKDQEPTVVPEQTGRRFETDLNREMILTNLGSFIYGNLPFKVSAVTPKINQKIATAAIPKTRELLKRSLKMTAKDKTYEIPSSEMGNFLAFVARPADFQSLKSPQVVSEYILNPEISPEKVGARLDQIGAEVNQEAKEPKFQVSGGKVAAFELGQTGYELDKEVSTKLIIDAITNNQPEVALPVKVKEPSLGTSDPNELGLKEMIGLGQTSWAGSPQNRIHNLSLGASLISGTIVKPGEEFSTVKTIGPIDAEHGFLEELVIKNSTEVTPEYGGGLCQVSTTLFRAVLDAGLEITARTPHSFRVSYYEPPVGMDATIYDPAPDFRFINNMPTAILIWANASSHGLDFQIYGTKDGRKVEISEPTLFDYVSAPGDVYLESSKMGAGDIRQVERATSGVTASFNYKVTDAAGKVLQSETYISKYVPIPNTFFYGPGTEGIPNQNPAPQVEATQAPAAPTPAPTPTPTPTKKKR